MKQAGKNKRIVDKIQNLLSAWGQYAPESKFGGMSLSEFKTATRPSLENRDQLASIRQQVKGAITARVASDLATRELVKRVVAGVVADPTYGAKSPMYSALNYVTDLERASGLKKSAASATPTTPAPTTSTTTTSNSSAPSTN